MGKYITLVFEIDTAEKLRAIREVAMRETCRAWSMDHEILRLELIEQALDADDIEKAKSHFYEVDVSKNQLDPSPVDDLFAESINQLEKLGIVQ